MNNSEVIQKTADFIKEKMYGEGSGHDWWHIVRVWNNAKTICQKEGGDTFIVELGALLHDIADWKFTEGDEKAGGKAAAEWLKSIGADEETVNKVSYIVDNVSFKGGAGTKNMQTLEGEIVQDADRLDALGAIGIARCFAYGGSKNREIYNPDIVARENLTKEEYMTKGAPSINHFYEKLLKLKDLMNTPSGKQIAEQRHKYMEDFLEQFFAEWEGER